MVPCVGDDRVVLEMSGNPINDDRVLGKSMRRLWFANMDIDDNFINFTLGLLQLEDLHAPGRHFCRWLYLNTFFMHTLISGCEYAGCDVPKLDILFAQCENTSLTSIACREYDAKKMTSWVLRSIKKLPGRTWASLTHIFTLVHLKPPESCLHWVAVVVNLCAKTVSCYDPLQASTTAIGQNCCYYLQKLLVWTVKLHQMHFDLHLQAMS